MKPAPKEKVFRILGLRIKYETACVAAVVIILALSSFGYITMNEPTASEQENKIQARVAVDFGNFSAASRIVAVNQGESAYAAFKHIANITTENTKDGAMPISVSNVNKTETNNQTDWWVFYVNGAINFNGLDRYEVKNGDYLDLRFEHEPY